MKRLSKLAPEELLLKQREDDAAGITAMPSPVKAAATTAAAAGGAGAGTSGAGAALTLAAGRKAAAEVEGATARERLINAGMWLDADEDTSLARRSVS